MFYILTLYKGPTCTTKFERNINFFYVENPKREKIIGSDVILMVQYIMMNTRICSFSQLEKIGIIQL